MLIERNKLEPNIRTLKLISGEEIICKVISNNDKDIVIKYPLLFVISNNDKLSNDVVFCPWVISMDFESEISIQHKNILANILPSKIAMEKYIESIG